MTSPTANIASLNGLHRLLHWPQQPDRPMQPLRLTVAPAGDEFLISSDTQTTTAPVGADRLAQMLEYYPAPVRINGDQIKTLAFPDRPRALEVGVIGGIAGQPRTAPQRRLPDSATTGQLLRCQGVIYELFQSAGSGPGAGPPAPPDIGMAREIRLPEPEPAYPHWSAARRYRIEYNIDWNDRADLPCSFVSHSGRAWCIPEADGWAELQEQQEAQELWVWTQIRSAAGGSDVAPAAATYTAIRRRLHWPGWHADGEATDLYVNAPAQAAHIDIAASQQDCLGYTLATALYTNPAAGYVPALSYPGWQERGPNPPETPPPSLTGAGVAIVGPDGQRLEYDPAQNYGAPTDEFWPEAIHRRAQSIAIRVQVAAPDGTTGECVIPANAAFLGEYADECVWLAEGYDGDVAALRDALFAAYWPHHDPPEEMTSEEYADQMRALATRLLEGDRAAFALEFQQLADNFYPQTPPSATSRPLATTDYWNRMVWLPREGDAMAGAALAAVVGYCLKLSSEEAQALGERLREWLETTGRAAEMRGWLAKTQAEDQAEAAWTRAERLAQAAADAQNVADSVTVNGADAGAVATVVHEAEPAQAAAEAADRRVASYSQTYIPPSEEEKALAAAERAEADDRR